MPPPFGLPSCRGMTQGPLYHEVKGLGLVEYLNKFQICSIKGTKVMSSKRNLDINLNVNLYVNW